MVMLLLPAAAAGVGRLSWCAGDLAIIKKGASISVAPEIGSAFRRGYQLSSGLFTMLPHVRKAGTVASASLEANAAIDQRQLVLLRKTLGAWVKPYLEKNSSVGAALNLISAHDGSPVTYDHVAFRTFGIDGCGIDSIAEFFMDFGYKKREELFFPGKKLRAFWYSPPEQFLDIPGDGVDGPLPRIFVSEILVEELSVKAQEIIKKYTRNAAPGIKYPVLAGVLNSLPWPIPHFAEYQQLASESEYAAWTLVNGYTLNHLTVSVHRLLKLRKIEMLNQLLLDHDIRLNTEGGTLKVSPDGGLQQSSTVADSAYFTFADGEVKTVPASYLEFAERLVLPRFENIPENEVREWHRRDGFEVGNADKIFASTFSGQTGVQ